MDYDRLRELQQKFEENPRRYFAPLANEYRKGGQPKRAIEICRAQLEHMPGHMSGQIVYGQALYEAGEYAEARQVFERALTLDPENLIALRSLGDMSLQAGNTGEARDWYSRLLDADPKDTAVIALISEIDASTDAKPVTSDLTFLDTDIGDQQIPEVVEEEIKLQEVEPAPSAAPEAASASSDAAAQHESTEREEAVSAPAPLGLERHYPVEETPVPPPEPGRPAEEPAIAAEAAGSPPAAQSSAPEARNIEGPSIEDLGVPAGASAAEGLTSSRPDVKSALDTWESPPDAPPQAEQTQRAEAPAREPEHPVREQEIAVSPSARHPDFTERVEPAQKSEAAGPTEEKTFSGASAEPFVNETMAQLYLKQGYKQLALKVYRQLVFARPNDEALRKRIAEIEAEDAAEHPGEVSVQRASEVPDRPVVADSPPSREPARRESVEAPAHEPARRESVEAPAREPARRESVEEPARQAPFAQTGAFAARQPSIREFFATLGRRRPPRSASGGGSRPGNNQPIESAEPFGASPPAATLDSVFAGASVSPADARAASRLAGAFSGASGTSRTTPPTPPMPTPRVNARVQAQESEEDVAKFRAWLDGLTGE